MQKIVVSISIVHYKKYSLTRSLLRSIYGSKSKIQFEVIVVDNDEHKTIKSKILKEFPKVIYIKSKENRGYGAGNNSAFQVSQGEYFFVLNPDTIIKKGTLETLVSFLEKHKKVAVVAPQLLDANSNSYSQLPTKRLTPLRGVVTLSFLNKLLPKNIRKRLTEYADTSSELVQYVDTVPGSALMIRSAVFREIGMYDEQFFLYFEESDLGKRLTDKGYLLALIKSAQVTHLWGKTTEGDKRADEAFLRSRYYFFKKHYGISAAVLVEAFARFSKWTALLLLITLLGGFFRFYLFPERMTFHGELGHNYLIAREYIEKHQIPLVGPPTSHPWLDFGPLFYWLIMPVLALAQFNPAYANGFITFLHVLLPSIAYFSTKRFLGKKAAFVQAVLLAISPMLINFSREARFFSLTLLLTYPFIYFFMSEKYFVAGVLFSIILNFHLTPVILIPVIALTLIGKKRRDMRTFVLGALIPQIPYLIHCLLFDREQLIRLFMWFPYRVLGFFGLVSQNTVTSDVIQGNTTSLGQFLGSSLSYQHALIMSPFVFMVIIYYLIKVHGSFHRFVKLILLTGLAAIFIHGNPPDHYYLPLIPFLFIIISTVLSKFKNIAVLITISLIVLINALYYVGPDNRFNNGLVPYDSQVKIIRNIQSEAGKDPYWIHRVGPFDQFEDDYAQNYLYLADYLGQKATRDASHIFTIHEKGQNIWYEKNF